MTIRRLPDYLVNQIAAGEVIERPASALKEMLENALDAGSTNIEIDLEMGGKSLIRVRDDGCGMGKDDLTLALTRHATSKLPHDNLDAISTLGFRGEALPSVASVSRMTVVSRKDGTNESWLIDTTTNTVTPHAVEKGTLIEIRDLFHRVPARLKFLKTDAAEFTACKDVVLRLALAYPHVAFLLRYGQTKLHFPAQDLAGRISQVLGLNTHDNLVTLDVKHDSAAIKGLIGLPTLNRGDTSQQFFFVNQRPVRDRLLYAALKVGYGDLIPKDRHGICVLFIDVPSNQLDVNVHPAKTEVRFAKAGDIRSLIISAIKNRLSQEAGQLTAQNLSNAALSYFSHNNAALHHQAPFSTGFSEQSFDLPPSARGEFHNDNVSAHPLGAARAQIHENYIIAQTNDGIVIIDQHAAHERLTYEALKSQLQTNITRQGLLSPDIVNVNPEQAEKILSVQNALHKLGLELESFGADAVIIRSIPAILADKLNAQQFITDLLEKLNDKSAADVLEEKLLHALATTACHWSIRSGRRLNADEMNTLLRQMEKTPHSGQCNHGRPTFVKLSLKDLESLFERR